MERLEKLIKYYKEIITWLELEREYAQKHNNEHQEFYTTTQIIAYKQFLRDLQSLKLD